MKPTNAFKCIGESSPGCRIGTTTAHDVFPFADTDRASVEDAWARALRRAEQFEAATVVVYRRPVLCGEWDTIPAVSDPLPVALPGQEDDDVPGHTGDLFGHVARGQA